MIQFPETAAAEWKAVADAANKPKELRRRVAHEVKVEQEVEVLRRRHEAKVLFQQELEEADIPTLTLGTVADYLANPANTVEDMIEGVMKKNGLCIVLGPSGVGKTTNALQMIHSLLTGDDWLGQKVPQISGSVGLLSYDQDAALSVNWLSRTGLPHDRVSVVNANGIGNPLHVPKYRKQIADAWRAANVEVVVVDSFSASFVGMDQNDAGATMAYYKDIKKFAMTEVGAKALIVIVHSTAGSPEKPRGSTVHNDVADSMVVVAKHKSGKRQVSMGKYREGLGQAAMEPVLITAPDSVTHLVSVDLAEMALDGMHIPASVAAQVQFPDLPESINKPDTDSEDEEIDKEDDL